jgi:hypothetical protein
VRVALAVIAGVAAATASCSSSDPQIMQTDVRVVATYDPRTGDTVERLSVSVDVHDPDGAEDLELVRTVLHPYDLVWECPVSETFRIRDAGTDWYVCDDIAPPEGTAPFRLTIEVEDKSLRTAGTEVTVPVDQQPTDPDSFAVVAGDGGSRTVIFPEDARTVYILAIDDDGRRTETFIIERPETGTEVELPARVIGQLQGRAVYAFIDRSRYRRLVSGPWDAAPTE